MNKEFFSTTELAELLGISRIAVYKRIKKGKIKAKKIAGNYVIERKDLGGILDKEFTDKDKKEIEEVVKKTVEEYGETLELLGKND